MRITSIDLAGSAEKGKKLPRAYAKISRAPGDDHITVEILMPGNERTHHVQADCDEDLWSMAECLQHALDGYEGTNGDIDGYYRAIQMLAD